MGCEALRLNSNFGRDDLGTAFAFSIASMSARATDVGIAKTNVGKEGKDADLAICLGSGVEVGRVAEGTVVAKGAELVLDEAEVGVLLKNAEDAEVEGVGKGDGVDSNWKL